MAPGVFRVVVDGESVDLSVRGVSRSTWTLLLDGHPGRGGTWDQDTLPPALIAACTDLSAEQAQDAWDEWPATDAEALFTTCLQASMPRSWRWALDRFKADGRLALEVRVAAEMGIPHSVFIGWSDRDQDLALASAELTAARCPGCGAPEEAMTDPSKAEVVVKACWMCRAKAATQDSIPEGERGHTHVMVVPVSTP